MNAFAENLKQAMEEGLSRHQVSLAAATGEEPLLCPEQEEVLNQVVLSTSRNVLQRSGSEQDLYDDVTGFNACFPQDMVTVIIEELSDRPLLRVVSDQLSQSTMDSNRIADKALSRVSISADPKTGNSEEAIPGTSANKTPTGTEELLVQRIPCVSIKRMPIAPDLGSDHLQVIAIKPESLEEPQEAFIAQAGDALGDLRTSLTEKWPQDERSRSEAQRQEDSHFSLVSIGQTIGRPGQFETLFEDTGPPIPDNMAFNTAAGASLPKKTVFLV
ncbi:hypothetical protein Y1Q_0001009 [Alligator mississippiensis]|uniref:Fibrous sheath-interacting protein 2 C-terminal domain-containing protein n=1 Tax=Alligator mississippiensis TaxID=8496 RepID=A0A151NE73_ALLMI|nr:hypothetical protein Y1Q_0001009 [Alligator mississippiensis]